MECDVAVLGGGPGGYPAAIRAAQLGASVVLIEQARGRAAPASPSAASRRRRGCRRRTRSRRRARRFAQIGVRVSDPELDFGQAQKNKARHRGRARERHHGRRQGQRHHGRERPRRVHRPEHHRGRGRGGRHVPLGRHRDRLALAAPAGPGHRRPGAASTRPACSRSTTCPGARDPRRRRDRRRVRLDLAPLRQRGDDRRDARAPDPDGGRRRRRKELERAFKRRGIATHLGARATEVAAGDDGVTLRFEGADGKGGSVDADLVLVATGRGARRRGIGLERVGVQFDPRRGVIADRRMRTNVAAHLRGRGRRGRLPARPHRVPRGRGRGRERDRPRRRDGLLGRAPLRLHRSRGGRRRPDRGAGARAARRRRRRRPVSVRGVGAGRRCTARRPASPRRSTRSRYGELLGLVDRRHRRRPSS